MERGNLKTIEFNGERISNLEELFESAKELYNQGWYDQEHPNNVYSSHRNIRAWLEPEDAVIFSPHDAHDLELISGLWYRYYGKVQLFEVFHSNWPIGQHQIIISPCGYTTYDVIASDEEPDGRKHTYKEMTSYNRYSKLKTTAKLMTQEEQCFFLHLVNESELTL